MIDPNEINGFLHACKNVDYLHQLYLQVASRMRDLGRQVATTPPPSPGMTYQVPKPALSPAARDHIIEKIRQVYQGADLSSPTVLDGVIQDLRTARQKAHSLDFHPVTESEGIAAAQAAEEARKQAEAKEDEAFQDPARAALDGDSVLFTIEGRPYRAARVDDGWRVTGGDREYLVSKAGCTCIGYQHRRKCRHLEAVRQIAGPSAGLPEDGDQPSSPSSPSKPSDPGPTGGNDGTQGLPEADA